MESLQPEPVKIKGLEPTDFWQKHMKKALQEIQEDCDNKVDLIQANCDAKLESQVRHHSDWD